MHYEYRGYYRYRGSEGDSQVTSCTRIYPSHGWGDTRRCISYKAIYESKTHRTAPPHRGGGGATRRASGPELWTAQEARHRISVRRGFPCVVDFRASEIFGRRRSSGIGDSRASEIFGRRRSSGIGDSRASEIRGRRRFSGVGDGCPTGSLGGASRRVLQPLPRLPPRLLSRFLLRFLFPIAAPMAARPPHAAPASRPRPGPAGPAVPAFRPFRPGPGPHCPGWRGPGRPARRRRA